MWPFLIQAQITVNILESSNLEIYTLLVLKTKFTIFILDE